MFRIVSKASEKPPTPFLPNFRIDNTNGVRMTSDAINTATELSPLLNPVAAGKALHANANPKPNYKLDPMWIAATLTAVEQAGARATPVFPNGKTQPFGANQDYKNPKDYSNAVAIGLVLDNRILLDYDANKSGAKGIICLEDLAQKLELKKMPPLFQTNKKGDSLHWLFRLPADVDPDTLKASSDGWLKHVDIKTGNQLVHLKPDKDLPNGIPAIDGLPEVSRVIIEALRRPKPKLSVPRSTLPVNETPELLEHINEVLSAIPPNIDYDQWRNVVWGLASLGLNYGYGIASNWSAGSTEQWNNGGEEALEKIYHGYDPTRGITFRTAEYIARKHGWVDARRQINGITFEGIGGDDENGRLFASEFRGELIHLSQGGWLKFAPDSGWIAVNEQEIIGCAKDILAIQRRIASDTIKQGDDWKTKKMLAHIRRTQSVNGIKAMIEMAKSELSMTVDASEFDANPWLLGVKNGVLDLKTGDLIPVTPDLYISKKANVVFDSSAECPLFMEALAQWQPASTVRRFLQRLFGVCITGEPHIQQLVFFHGQGANGKSVLIELMQSLFGEYCTPIQTEMLMRQQRSSQGPSPDILQLKGARLAFCNELNEGARLDESRVKQLTGGDTLVGRAPYAKAELSFRPSHNLIMIGNHQPSVSDTSEGMWRRLLLIPFDHTIPEDKRDPNLLTKLLEEAPGILNWLIEGLVDYRENGLNAPEAVSQATKEYRSEEDILGIFIEEKFIRKLEGKTDCQTAYSLYMAWCYQNGHGTLSKAKFTKRLKTHNINRDKGRRNYTGIEVIPFNRTLH